MRVGFFFMKNPLCGGGIEILWNYTFLLNSCRVYFSVGRELQCSPFSDNMEETQARAILHNNTIKL